MGHILLLVFLVNSGLLSAARNGLEYSQLERDEGVKYLTYTKHDKKNSVDIRQVNFNDGYATVFIVHGFDMKTLEEPLQAKNDIFQFNLNVERVIIVSWLDLSRAPGENSYERVARNHVPLLAQDVAEKIVHIRESGGAEGVIEIIGHSVGAHVAGQTGKLLKKRHPKYTLDQIFGLDPAGAFFEQNRQYALSNEDSKNVVVLHTNMHVYGFGSLIGHNDKKVNGGEKQSNCKVNIDICSHNAAWNAYSNYLSNKLITKEKERFHPYVICMDVSSSMNTNKRLQRAIHSAQKVISNVKSGSYLGFVKFNHEARKVHDIIQVKGSSEKQSLLTSLPSSADGYTSIGSGLRLSMNMLQAMPNSSTFCSTIVLISDGEQTHGESAQVVLPDLQKSCIAISTIALGKDASNDLEAISVATGGVVAYAMEDGTSNDVIGAIRALSYLFENDEADQPIRLSSKEVILGGDGGNDVQFMIDDTVGKDTEFSIVSYDADKVDVTLTSPDGQLYTSTSSKYFFDKFSEKGFRIEHAEPGQWTLTVRKMSKRRRSIRSQMNAIIAQATTHQSDTKPAAIRLTAIVSDRILEYNKPITITAELYNGGFPIIYAEVFANIEAPNQPVIRLPLFDNGIFPDELANDGIYTNNVVKLPKPERYSVVIIAKSNATALQAPEKINYFTKKVIDCKKISCPKIGEFERETDVGSIKLLSNAKQNEIPPNPVSDLRAAIVNFDQRIFSLEWTSPRNEIFDISIKRYDVRVLVNGTDFENGIKFGEADIVDGSLDVSNPNDRNGKISIQMAKEHWDYVLHRNRSQKFGGPAFRFALKSVGYNGYVSSVSNIVSVSIKETTEAPEVIEETTTEYTESTPYDVYTTTTDLMNIDSTGMTSDVYITTTASMNDAPILELKIFSYMSNDCQLFIIYYLLFTIII